MTIFRDNDNDYGDAISQAVNHLLSVTDDGGWCAYLLRPVTLIPDAVFLMKLPENEGMTLMDFEYGALWRMSTGNLFSEWDDDGTYSA